MAVKASDAARGEVQREESEGGAAAPEGKQQRRQSSTLHRNQSGTLQLDKEHGRLAGVAADSGSENPRPSPPSLTSSATQVAGDLGTRGPTQTTNAPRKLPT